MTSIADPRRKPADPDRDRVPRRLDEILRRLLPELPDGALAEDPATAQAARAARIAAQAAATRAARERQLLADRLTALNLPPVLRTTRFETLDPAPQAEAFRVCQEYADHGQYHGRRGLLLVGPPGCGKTTLAVAILRRCLERTQGRFAMALWNVPAGLEHLREALRRGVGQEGNVPPSPLPPTVSCQGTPEDDDAPGAGASPVAPGCGVGGARPARLLDLLNNRVVVLDDLAGQRITAWVADQFFMLLDGFWAMQRQVIVTTNQTPSMLGECLGTQVMSRLLGLCHPVTLQGRDLRVSYA